MSVSIVILNYRTPELTIDCLRSLAPEAAGLPGCAAVIVDNDSRDGSEDRIRAAITREGWEAWASVMPTGHNGGFAYGNNRGIEAVRRNPYLLLLNSDTVVHPGVLQYCKSVMDADAGIGAMSCLVLNRDGTIQNVARPLPSPPRLWAAALGLPWLVPKLFRWADTEGPGWDRNTARDVGWIGGAFMFVRRDLLDRIGGLDEDFFFYGEDIEFCHRVWRSGYRCHYSPGATIVHYGGGSSDPTRVLTRQKNAMIWTARYLVQRKCYGAAAATTLRLIDRIGLRVRLLKKAVTGRRGTEEYRTLSDVLSLVNKQSVSRLTAAGSKAALAAAGVGHERGK